MLSIKPDRKPDPAAGGGAGGAGQMIDDFWGPSRKLLSDREFLEKLISLDKDNIDAGIMDKIRNKCAHHLFSFCSKHSSFILNILVIVFREYILEYFKSEAIIVSLS